jgi:PPE-repeat protein
MMMATTPYVAWLMTSAAQCESTAAALFQAAGCHATAFAATIPPPVITENRTELATLIATNFLGVNSAAIAANEALYQEYWAQDAGAMEGMASDFAGVVASLVPTLPPMMSTDPAGLAAQAASVGEAAGQSAGQAGSQVGSVMGQTSAMPGGLSSMSSLLSAGPQAMSTIPQVLQGLTSPLTSGLSSMMAPFQSLLSPLMGGGMFGNMMTGLGSGVGSGVGSSLGGLPQLSGMNSFAAMGRSSTLSGVGPRLSVPTAWGENDRTVSVVRPLEEGAVTEENAAVVPQGGMMIPPGARGMGQGGSGSATVVANPTRRESRRLPSLSASRFVPEYL